MVNATDYILGQIDEVHREISWLCALLKHTKAHELSQLQWIALSLSDLHTSLELLEREYEGVIMSPSSNYVH